MTFYQRPFLSLTAILIVGILLGLIYPSQLLWLVLLVGMFSVTIVVHLKRWNGVFVSCVFAGFVSLGAFLSSLNAASDSFNEISSSFVVEVIEQSTTEKNWKKGIGKILSIKKGNELISANEKLLFFSTHQFQVGDVLYVNSKVDIIRNKNNPGEFDAEAFWNNKSIYHITFISDNNFQFVAHQKEGWLNTQLKFIRDGFSRFSIRTLGKENGGILNAILLGDKSNLTTEVTQSFSNTGAMHVLAVSGMHVGIIMWILMFVFGKVRFLSKMNALILTLIFVWFYAFLTGLSPSVLRSAVMFSILIGAQVTSSKSDSLNVLFFSAFLLLVVNPNYLFDLGFQLSYLAVLGILVFNKKITELWYVPNKWLRKVWEGSVIGISAQIFTIPLMLYHFHQFPNYFLLANIGVMIFSGVILAVGIFLLFARGISLLANILQVVIAISLNGLLFSIQFVDQLPGAVASGFQVPILVILLLYFLLFVALLFQGRQKVLAGAVATFVLLFGIIQWTRYEQMSSAHFVVFNHNKPTMIWKEGEKILCFHSNDLEKVKPLVQGYNKIYPGNVQFIEMKKGKALNVMNGTNKIIIRNQYDGISVEMDGKNYLLRQSYRKPQRNYDEILFMPNIMASDNEKRLSEGAIYLSF